MVTVTCLLGHHLNTVYGILLSYKYWHLLRGQLSNNRESKPQSCVNECIILLLIKVCINELLFNSIPSLRYLDSNYYLLSKIRVNAHTCVFNCFILRIVFVVWKRHGNTVTGTVHDLAVVHSVHVLPRSSSRRELPLPSRFYTTLQSQSAPTVPFKTAVYYFALLLESGLTTAVLTS